MKSSRGVHYLPAHVTCPWQFLVAGVLEKQQRDVVNLSRLFVRQCSQSALTDDLLFEFQISPS